MGEQAQQRWEIANERRRALGMQHLAQEPKPGHLRTPQGPAKICHYCGDPGFTRDHIVARAYIVKYWRYRTLRPKDVNNYVPACAVCNMTKGDYRSDCQCEICTAAWEAYRWESAPPVPVIPVKLIALIRKSYQSGDAMVSITMFDGVIDQLDYAENRMLQKIHMSDGYGRTWTLTITGGQGLEQSFAAGQDKVAFMDRRPKVTIEGEFE